MNTTDEKLRTIRELIDRITTSERVRTSAHFSDAVYRDEPILTTGRQMASYLPERYRAMKEISRWQEGEPHGRWLSEAELFYRQGTFMADFEDDCPYTGTFKSYYPTYNAMSDHQLRGYFTWRTQVRRGNIHETSLSFFYLYIYELLCGIGVASPRDGFEQLKNVWKAYRAFAPEIDRFVEPWLRDYAIYHGLDPALLEDDPIIAFDRALFRLVRASAPFDPEVLEHIDELALEPATKSISAAAAPSAPELALPLPPDAAREQELLEAIDGLSTYRVRLARLYHDHPDDLRHVACAVYVRMLQYCRKHRANGFIEGLFGEQARMPYTMFASAVFFEPTPHQDADYLLDPIHGFRCRNGRWSCIRTYGAHEKSAKLGALMRAVDRKLRDALSYPHALKARKVPKYLETMIDKEIAAWLSWKEAHAPRRIDIDLSQLAGIRSSAAEIREALLTDEEREGTEQANPSAEHTPSSPSGADPGISSRAQTALARTARETICLGQHPASELDAQRALNLTDQNVPLLSAREDIVVPEGDGIEAARDLGGSSGVDGQVGAEPLAGALLSEGERAYLTGLLDGCGELPAGVSEDMLVDAINEKLFDVVGDTVIEFGADGAQVIEDYEDEVRGVLGL